MSSLLTLKSLCFRWPQRGLRVRLRPILRCEREHLQYPPPPPLMFHRIRRSFKVTDACASNEHLPARRNGGPSGTARECLGGQGHRQEAGPTARRRGCSHEDRRRASPRRPFTGSPGSTTDHAQFCVRKSDITLHGYTIGCKGCTANSMERARQGHTDACRARVMELLRSQPQTRTSVG